MTWEDIEQKIDDLKWYGDYFIAMRSIELGMEMMLHADKITSSLGGYFWSFEDFCNKEEADGGLMIDNWKRKWPNGNIGRNKNKKQ